MPVSAGVNLGIVLYFVPSIVTLPPPLTPLRGIVVFSLFVPPEPKHHPRVFPHYLYNTTLHTAHAGDGDGKPWEYIVHPFDGRSVKPQHIHVQPSPTDHSLSATGRPIPGLSSSPAASPSSLSLLCWRWEDGAMRGSARVYLYLRAG